MRIKPSICLFLLLSLSSLNAVQKAEPPPPLVIQKQLSQAEVDFETAKKMFNPYYAGPLLTPSANNVPPGVYVLQPYLFVIDTYAQFTSNRKSLSIPDIWKVNPVLLFQRGLTSWLDFTLNVQGIYNTQHDQSSANFGDTQIQIGFQMMKEQLYRPAVRFVIGETFPTGKYEKLNPKKNGIDSTGQGTFLTTFSLNLLKTIWWISTHPMSYRLSLNYSVPSVVYVQEFNTYGGGYRTRGRVYPGNIIALDTSLEFSFTQNWVLAIDLAYTYQNKSDFSGHKGQTALGTIASVGQPSQDQLSCAPAIEYNPKTNLNFLLGAWFTITGRNSSDFIGGVFSMIYSW